MFPLYYFRGALSGLRRFLATESPLKMMKNIFGHVEKQTKKVRLVSKFMMSQPGKHTITIHILPNISKSKGNWTMKFGQLIKYNMRNSFLEKSYKKCDGESIPRPFSKKSKLSISLNQQSEFLFSLLYLQINEHQNILKLRCRPLVFTFYKGFLKNRKRSGTSLPVSA